MMAGLANWIQKSNPRLSRKAAAHSSAGSGHRDRSLVREARAGWSAVWSFTMGARIGVWTSDRIETLHASASECNHMAGLSHESGSDVAHEGARRWMNNS